MKKIALNLLKVSRLCGVLLQQSLTEFSFHCQIRLLPASTYLKVIYQQLAWDLAWDRIHHILKAL